MLQVHVCSISFAQPDTTSMTYIEAVRAARPPTEMEPKTMTRITPAEAVLMMPTLPRNAEAERIEAIVAQARAARDDAFAERIRGAARFLRHAVTALRNRRETIEQLRLLTDRELADIGLSRGNILAAAQAAAPLPANDHADDRHAA